MLALVMLLCACSAGPSYPKTEIRFRLSETSDPTYAIIVPDPWEFSNYTPVSEEWKTFLDTTYLSQVEFMNTTYDADWTYTPMEFYFVDLTESLPGIPYWLYIRPQYHSDLSLRGPDGK